MGHQNPERDSGPSALHHLHSPGEGSATRSPAAWGPLGPFPSPALCLSHHRRAQPRRTQQVVRQRIPQRDRLDLGQATHQHTDQPATTRQRVDAFGRRGSLLVDLLGLIRPHPLPPCRYRRTVVRLRRVPVHFRIFGLGHRRVHRAAHLWHADRLDLIVLREAAIDQVLGRDGPVTLLDLVHHRHHLTRVTADGDHVHPDDHLAGRRRRELEVVRRAEPASAIFITVASASVVEHRAWSFSSGFFLASNSGNRSSAFLIRSACSRAARSWAAFWRRSVAAGSSSNSSRRASTCSWAWANASSNVGRRRNEAAPALARTRIPSCATRFNSTKPSAISVATLLVNKSSSSARWSVRKSARLW